MINLLYPEGCEPVASLLNEKAIDFLELNYIAMLICPYNTDFALKTLTELITDENVIRWRQDILEDFINIPQLEKKLYSSIHTIYEGALSVYAKTGSTQSFFELSENISNIESFLDCMKECHDFIAEYGSKIKSDGIKMVFDEIDSRYTSENFRLLIEEIAELKKAMNDGVKSVTFGINLDNLMRPLEIMLLSVDYEPICKKSLFDKLLNKKTNAEPLTEIYSRKCKDGQFDAINEKLFIELDKLGGDYLKHINSAVNLCYKETRKGVHCLTWDNGDYIFD
ncbi:MAG: hypothetical protein ACI4J7_10720, partial [Ruminiclostridium sp.]